MNEEEVWKDGYANGYEAARHDIASEAVFAGDINEPTPRTVNVPVEDVREFIADSVAVEQWYWDNSKIINKKRDERINRTRKLLEGLENAE